jgi:hypothetical protein
MIFIAVSCSTTGRGSLRRDAKFSRRLFTFSTPFYFQDSAPPGSASENGWRMLSTHGLVYFCNLARW